MEQCLHPWYEQATGGRRPLFEVVAALLISVGPAGRHIISGGCGLRKPWQPAAQNRLPQFLSVHLSIPVRPRYTFVGIDGGGQVFIGEARGGPGEVGEGEGGGRGGQVGHDRVVERDEMAGRLRAKATLSPDLSISLHQWNEELLHAFLKVILQ
jgi:hypothetical protein